jgi:hypothetical protein
MLPSTTTPGFAFAEIMSDETAMSVLAFTEHALEFFSAAGVEVSRIITDNGSGYR